MTPETEDLGEEILSGTSGPRLESGRRHCQVGASDRVERLGTEVSSEAREPRASNLSHFGAGDDDGIVGLFVGGRDQHAMELEIGDRHRQIGLGGSRRCGGERGRSVEWRQLDLIPRLRRQFRWSPEVLHGFEPPSRWRAPTTTTMVAERHDQCCARRARGDRGEVAAALLLHPFGTGDQ